MLFINPLNHLHTLSHPQPHTQEFNDLYKRHRNSRAGMFFTLPVFLVACRLTVHLLFSSLYKLWIETEEGATALEQMDEAIVYLFDPSGYLQKNLTILQSTPAAVSIITKHPQLGHGAERVHLSDVSPLMRAAMQQPASHQTRKLLLDGSKHKPSRHQTTNNRAVAAKGAAVVAAADIPPGATFPCLPSEQMKVRMLSSDEIHVTVPHRCLRCECVDRLSFRSAL